MAFLVICLGITILQMSKVDPEKLNKLDRRSTILLQAARAQTATVDEKGVAGYEDPGMDTLRGSFGAFGSIIRARTARRMSQSSNTSHLRVRPPGAAAPYDHTASWMSSGHPPPSDGLAGMKRHQLYDAPVPRDDASSLRAPSVRSQLVNKRPTIKFDDQELVHSYSRPGQPQSPPTHEHRQAIHGSILIPDGYPPLPPTPSRDTAMSEGNLLGLETPDMSKLSSSVAIAVSPPSTATITPGTSMSQMISVPALMSGEHTVHSAPPTMYARVPRPGVKQPTRQDSRDIFNDPTTAAGRTTLLSFPSVTDSAPSQWGDEDSADLRKMSIFGRSERSLVSAAKEPERSREREIPRTPKRYPKGLDDDDRAESESLWRDKPPSTESDDSLPPDLGSIRLVPSGSKF